MYASIAYLSAVLLDSTLTDNMNI